MRNPPLAISFDDVFVLYQSRDEFAQGVRSGVLATFGHAVAALRGLSLDVREGERIVVRGPSGSGKSTLVSVVTGQVAPSAGVVRFFDRGLPIGGEVLRRSGRLAVVMQGSGRELVPEISCLHNVALNAELRGVSKATARRDAEVLLGRFGVGELASRMPTDLSGGEAQKVALAAALGSSPAIVSLFATRVVAGTTKPESLGVVVTVTLAGSGATPEVLMLKFTVASLGSTRVSGTFTAPRSTPEKVTRRLAYPERTPSAS